MLFFFFNQVSQCYKRGQFKHKQDNIEYKSHRSVTIAQGSQCHSSLQHHCADVFLLRLRTKLNRLKAHVGHIIRPEDSLAVSNSPFLPKGISTAIWELLYQDAINFWDFELTCLPNCNKLESSCIIEVCCRIWMTESRSQCVPISHLWNLRWRL